MNQVTTVADFCDKISKGTFGISVQTRTVPNLKKTGNPFLGRVTKVSQLTNAILGVSYENTVNSHLEKVGAPADFSAESPSGMHWVKYPFILESDKTPGKMYLRITKRSTTSIKSTYFVDGREATPEEVALIRAFEPGHTDSQKQGAAGLLPAEQVVVMSYGIDTILSLQQGDLLYVKA